MVNRLALYFHLFNCKMCTNFITFFYSVFHFHYAPLLGHLRWCHPYVTIPCAMLTARIQWAHDRCVHDDDALWCAYIVVVSGERWFCAEDLWSSEWWFIEKCLFRQWNAFDTERALQLRTVCLGLHLWSWLHLTRWRQ